MTTAWTPTTWAEEVITDANLDAPSAPAIPIDPNTVSDILHWMPAEEPVGNWYDRNNPLNASLGTSSTEGLGSYPSLATGADETAKMIDQGNMAMIRNALASDLGPGGFSPAVVSSPWASGHYGGNPQAIAQTSPGGGPAPSSSGYVGQAPQSVDAGQLAALNESPSNASQVALNANPFDLFGIPQTIAGDAAGSLWSLVGPFIVKGMLVVTGLGIIVLGLSKAAEGGGDRMKMFASEKAPELEEAGEAAAA